MEGRGSHGEKPRTPFIKPEKGDEVVITGMAGQFPDSRDIYHFRDNLFNKVDLVSDDLRRWRPIYPEVPQRTGKLIDVQKFDPGFFGATKVQADNSDPMVRLALERSIEAVIDAGYNPSDFENTNTAVFAGSCFSETEKILFYDFNIPSSDTVLGNLRTMIANRVSYYLKLKAPSFIVDTACSSSMFAFEQAYIALKEGLCDKAIVSGAHVCLHPIVSLQFARLGVLSKDGSCKSFDDNGNGYVRSEAIVAVLLEKAKDAKRIYCEVVHAKTNCDGYKKEGITFPSSEAQIMLMRDFYDDCKIDPSILTFVEAHGTGTVVGDPEELNTLSEIFCKRRDRPLHIGAIKSNIGHNEPVSGLCSIVKVLIGMESGFMPPNINYEKPRKGVKALEDGRLVVVTEKMPLPDQRGYFGVNSFGFGGSNSHILLHWNTKAKRNGGTPEDDLPRLICVSGRTEEGASSILDDFKSRGCDSEYAYLIQDVFRKSIADYFHRAYGIYDKNGEVKRSLIKLSADKPELYFVFGHFDKEWLKLGPALMKIPIFAKNVERIQNILGEVGDDTVADVVSNSKAGGLVSQILGTVAVQISLADILKEIKLLPDRIVGVGSGELVAAYVGEYLTLKETILGLFYITSNLTKQPDWNRLQKIFPRRKNSYEKWIPINEENLRRDSARYFVDNIVASRNGRDIKKLLPKNAVSVIIGPTISDIPNNKIDLIGVEHEDSILDLLTSLGSLHQYGFEIELNKIYPPIQLPVSRGTPMLSPLIKWYHQKDYKLYLFDKLIEVKSEHRVMHIMPKEDEWAFIVGHAIDGRNLFPATGYLDLVWQSLSMAAHKLRSEMKIVFEDVRYIRAATVPKGGILELVVSIQMGAKTFEISESGVSIVTGKIYEVATDEDDFWDIPTSEEQIDLCLSERDVYKELKLRGYQYTGTFRGIKKCTVDASYATVQWEDNWITFMDCFLQLVLLQQDTRSIYIPTSIQRLVIDGPKHIEFAKKFGNMVPIRSYKDVGVIRGGGIELRGLGPSAIPRRKGGDPVLEISKFIPNNTKTNSQDSIRSFVQFVLENSNTTKVKVVEVCSENQTEDSLVCPVIQKALDDLPLMQQDVVVLAKQMFDLPRVTVQNKQLNAESNCLILIVSNILENIDVVEANNAVKDAKGFIISREPPLVNLAKFSGSPYTVLCSNSSEIETLVLLRPTRKVAEKTYYLNLTNGLDNLNSWIPRLQNLLKENKNVLLYAQDDELSGILGLVTCLRREFHGNRVSCVFILDDAPKFNPELSFYKEQLDKGLAFNIWKDGQWGTYRHLLLPDAQLVEREHCYVNVTTRGDLSTMSWLEGNVDPSKTIPEDREVVHVYYSALNFRDLMTASGKIPPEVITKDRIELECVQGFEFAGRNLKGERVVGMGVGGGLATLVQCKKLLLRIPDHWTMEDAATVIVVYGTVVEVLLNRNNLKSGQTILIHSATGGVGQAAIVLSLYYGLTVFATVGTREKREFLKQNYPQIKEEHIFSSRDIAFEEMIYKHTNGRGVDYVLNSLAEEKLLASIRCLARGGKFLEIGKFDLANNNPLALQLLEKDAQFIGVALDQHINASNTTLCAYREQMQGLIDCGVIKPLPRTVFQSDEVEKAFRYMGAGKHIGKVLIKIRDEEDQKVCQVPKTLYKAIPRFYCKPECSYLICGGLGGFGMELADLLVIRGAKKLVLTSRSGLSNGYQKLRIRMWKNYGATVVASTADASTEAGCTELLKIASEMGPVDGIFNLAAVLKDGLFENLSVEDFVVPIGPKAICTKNLDRISRRLCPNLRYFVIFSSISCGRGNLGQTNYGMANSVMERICEKRKKDGYPALAIQWGAIGEVGLVAKMQEDHRELVIGGTLQQRISSCLQVMDKFIAQDEPIVGSMLVAEKRYGGHASNLFDAVLNVMGLTNLKSVSVHTAFPDLGMDSMMAVEIKQTLEREYEVFLTAQDIRGMTLAKLKELANPHEGGAAVIVTQTPTKEDIPVDARLLLRIIGTEEFANVPVIKLKTLIKEDEDGPNVIALPGVEGMAAILEPLAKKLKAHISCLQFCTNYKESSIEELAEYMLPYAEVSTGNLILLAYSFGCIVATELLRKLEAKGKKAKVIFIDGSPDVMVEMLNTLVPIAEDNLFHTMMVSMVMRRYMPYDDILKQQEVIAKFPTYQEKIDYLLSISPRVETSRDHMVNMYGSIYDKLVAIKKYQLNRTVKDRLDSSVTLFKATTSTVQKINADYGLSKIFRDRIDVVTIESNHVTILESDDLASGINGILESIGQGVDAK
ncbi:hypothetical protein Trydic_g23233 [Trypoxylus dichotomus]